MCVSCQEWSQATGIAKAFKIGKLESEAVSALMSDIPESIVNVLEDAVRKRGLQRLMTHEVISKGIFSSSWTSGSGPAEAWKDGLRNREDEVLVLCLDLSCFPSSHVVNCHDFWHWHLLWLESSAPIQFAHYYNHF